MQPATQYALMLMSCKKFPQRKLSQEKVTKKLFYDGFEKVWAKNLLFEIQSWLRSTTGNSTQRKLILSDLLLFYHFQ